MRLGGVEHAADDLRTVVERDPGPVRPEGSVSQQQPPRAGLDGPRTPVLGEGGVERQPYALGAVGGERLDSEFGGALRQAQGAVGPAQGAGLVGAALRPFDTLRASRAQGTSELGEHPYRTEPGT